MKSPVSWPHSTPRLDVSGGFECHSVKLSAWRVAALSQHHCWTPEQSRSRRRWFLIIGYGNTMIEALKDHDNNLAAFLERARRSSLTLNAEKVQLCLKQVPFIGHLLTQHGLAPNPAKVEAITKMPPPADVKALKRLLGMVNYLAKFLPHLSTICKPLRQLEHQDVEWCWLEQHSNALEHVSLQPQYLPTMMSHAL